MQEAGAIPSKIQEFMAELQLETTTSVLTKKSQPAIALEILLQIDHKGIIRLHAPLRRIHKKIGKLTQQSKGKRTLEKENEIISTNNKKRKTYLATYCTCENAREFTEFLKFSYKKLHSSLVEKNKKQNRPKNPLISSGSTI